MVKDSKKKKEKPKESAFKKFVKKRAPIYLAVVAIVIVFIVPELTKGDLQSKLDENLTEEEKMIVDSLMSYNGPDDEGHNLYDEISNKISEEYPNEKIYDNKKTKVNVEVSNLEDENYQIIFDFESYKGDFRYNLNIDMQTGDVKGMDEESKNIIARVDFYD